MLIVLLEEMCQYLKSISNVLVTRKRLVTVTTASQLKQVTMSTILLLQLTVVPSTNCGQWTWNNDIRC